MRNMATKRTNRKTAAAKTTAKKAGSAASAVTAPQAAAPAAAPVAASAAAKAPAAKGGAPAARETTAAAKKAQPASAYKKHPLALIILDGFGYRKETEGNAIAMAKKPVLDEVFSAHPHTLIGASGMDVGLPDGQMGNSEVGHTNIGAGRIVYQELTRITKSIQDGSFFQNEAFLAAVGQCLEVRNFLLNKYF